jgi:DNA-binding PadR family transcriptional regulator
MANKPDLLPGTLDMLILKTLTRAPLHGYGIAQAIKQLSDDVLTVEEGSLYPALQRLLTARMGKGRVEDDRDEPARSLLHVDQLRA